MSDTTTAVQANPQHKNDILATNILYASLGVSLLLCVALVLTADAPRPVRSSMFGMLLLLHLLNAGLYYAIRLGKRWAKLLFLVLAVVSASSTVLPIVSGDEEALHNFRNEVWGSARQVLEIATDGWALIVLFRKPPLSAEILTQ